MTQTLINWDSPPAQRHSATSVAAAEAIAPSAGTLRYKLLTWLRDRGEVGATDEEMQLGVPMAASTQRPRRGELVAAGYVKDSGSTRSTKSGRAAVVWVANERPLSLASST